MISSNTGSVADQCIVNVEGLTSNCQRLFDEWESFAVGAGVPADIRHELKLVIEETFVNIASYAFDDNMDRTVEIKLMHHHAKEPSDQDIITISFLDHGIAFDPLAKSAPESQDSLDQGGMGIQLIRSLTDQQDYRRIDQRNVFTLSRRYTPR